jgi:outer membrane protein assembly factor BamB
MPHASASWPERAVMRESSTVTSQAISGGFRYALVSLTHTPIRGPYLLERTNLRTGHVDKGPRYPFGNLSIGSGQLWIYGAIRTQPGVIKVDPQTLNRIRSISLPKAPTANPWIAVRAGPADSLWIGTSRTLLRISAATGTTLVRLAAPPRLAVGDLAVDPSGRHLLYVSMAHVVNGGLEGGAVLEYDARTGRTLARSSARLLNDSVAGAALTAVPGGVWASFRTGMLGLTIHLRQQDLAMIAPPGSSVALLPANGLFHWPMSATTIYGGGSLWLANEAGIVACLDPERGTVRASERIPPSRQTDLLAVDTRGHRVFALQEEPRLQIVQLTPPLRCWT